MSFYDVNLKSSDRGILFAMQEASKAIETSQERINTGKKVNSAADDPIKFFTANTLQNNAFDYTKLKDTMSQAIKTLEATINGLNSIKSVLDSMQGTIDAARGTNDPQTRYTLSLNYTSLMNQVTNLANDASYNGRNLIKDAGAAGGTYDFTVYFGIDSTAKSSYVINPLGASAASLGLLAATTSWQTGGDIDGAQTLLTVAVSTIRSSIQTYGTHINMLKIRDDFTNKHIKALKDGAAALTEADTNEEAAKLNALKMAEYIGLSSLGFSTQLQQGVLKLLG